MIFSLHQIAKRIYFLRSLFLVLAGLLFVIFVFIVTSGNTRLDVYLPAVTALFGWCFCLYGIASGFINEPRSIIKEDGWFKRLKKKFAYFFAWILALIFTVCTVGLVYVSYSALRLSLASS